MSTSKRLREAVVLVTPRSYGIGDPQLVRELEDAVGEVRYNRTGRPWRAEELREQIADVDGMIAGLDEIDASVIAAAPRLRVIARYGVGTSNVDLKAAAQRGIVVTNTPGANAAAVAEMTLGLMIVLLRGIVRTDREVRGGAWPSVRGRELRHVTLGILGLGRIGRGVAERARKLGTAVIAHDPYADTRFAAECGITLGSFDDVIEQADILSLHMPPTEETRNIINRTVLARMRPGSYLINTARGDLVVEEDLLWALEEGPLAGAALDTLRQEPPPPDHPLLLRPDVILTSHIAGQTLDATREMGRQASADLLAVLAGRAPRYPVVAPPKGPS